MDKIKKTLLSLKSHHFGAYYVENRNELYHLLDDLISSEDIVASGGSETLKQLDISSYLNKRNINYLERLDKNRDELHQLFCDSFKVDTYLSSTNSLTSDGYLLNIDGNGNRVSAITFGPKQVIIIASVKKITDSIEEAYQRVKEVAVKNVYRLNKNTPCAKIGHCVDCHSDECICDSIVITRNCRLKERIKVILINEDLGY